MVVAVDSSSVTLKERNNRSDRRRNVTFLTFEGPLTDTRWSSRFHTQSSQINLKSFKMTSSDGS